MGLRLGNLQIVQHDSLSKQARGEINQQIQIAPRRGTIRDRAGNVLALDVDRESVFVVPQQIDQQNAPRLALMLASLLGQPAPEILERAAGSDEILGAAQALARPRDRQADPEARR